ncbi:MAG TPA: D-alanine--D-alanine ligase [Spirochaetia bacterium]|nr:D-alanine--D-alanine ligase [Spirochaetia bacterium]
MKRKVAILFGGRSQEHEVSLQSAASVHAVIPPDKFEVILIGIDRKGTWHLQEKIRTAEDPSRGPYLVIEPNPAPVVLVPGKGFHYQNRALPVDVVFPVLHGSFGEDGTLQGLLEMLDLPYVGAGVTGSAVAMDKEAVKRIWRDSGLPVVDFVAVHKHEFPSSPSAERALWDRIQASLSSPVFVKPAAAGSSVGVSKASTEDEVVNALREAFNYDTKAIVESGVDAREIELAVIGNEEPRVFPPGEVVVSEGFYSYTAKYLDKKAAVTVIPADLDNAAASRAMDLAHRAYQTAGVSGFARVDLFLDRKSGTFFVNEINTLPGFTNISMFSRLCEAGGLPYSKLVEELIEYGIERHTTRAALVY